MEFRFRAMADGADLRVVPAETTGRAAVAGNGAGQVLVLGGDADGNLGDRAILYAVCLALSRANPSVRITVVSSRPLAGGADGLPGVVRTLPPGPRGFRALLEAAREQDRILIGGGGLFQDDDSRVKMPYWAARLGLLARVNPELVALSVGAGPLRHPESRWSARKACLRLRSVSVRDGFAQTALQACTDQTVHIVPDPAFLLPAAAPEEADSFLRTLGVERGVPLIGVVLRGWFHRRGGFLPQRLRWRLGGGRRDHDGAMSHLVQDVARSVSALAAESGAEVVLLPSYDVGHEGDGLACRRLAAALHGTRAHLARIADPRLYKAVCGRLKLLISARMHPLILATAMGVPVVGLGYNDKFRGFFDMIGGPHYLMDLDGFRHGGRADALTDLAHRARREHLDRRPICRALARRVEAQAATLLHSAPLRGEVAP